MDENKFETADEIRLILSVMQTAQYSGNVEQMKQVLLNILLNGVEAMPDGGVLSINGHITEGTLCLEISDTGEGLPEEEIPRIFDLYFTTKETGTGLGLSIVQRVVMEHGGWVDVDSIQGGGTTFRIYLPDGG